MNLILIMANDPNRDLLPVKEENCCKGVNERVDHQILVKLSRSELEDRFLRLLDDQTQLKKLVNCQEEKIKRLGTKLLRIINDKKCGRKCQEQLKESEDLHLKIVELEHENYILKDKNTVLKQQLANHSRHMTIHRSPIRSNHASPLLSTRQSAPPLPSEPTYDSMNKNMSTETQLQEAEAHIRELNGEIKSLHHKIDCLEQNLEKNSLDSRKMKVTENIELIRLQRSLKQQAIQIASLQAQVKNSENNQKLLKEELIKAHNENDEALRIISIKQNEVLDLCSKLEKNNLNKLEENELRERINDLMSERDSLKERSDFLMKTIGAKNEENKQLNELKKLLFEEKLKNEKLEEALEAAQELITKFRNPNSDISDPCTNCEIQPSALLTEVSIEKSKKEPSLEEKPSTLSLQDEASSSLILNAKSSANIRLKSLSLHSCKCDRINFLNSEFENTAELSDILEEKSDNSDNFIKIPEEKYYAEKMKTERELQFLREMLRSQTSRCEAQQTEISRLMYELRLNEEKCNETLKKLDSHLKVFQHLEMKARQNKSSTPDTESLKERTTKYVQTAVDLESESKDSSSSEKLRIVINESEKDDVTYNIEPVKNNYKSFSGVENEKISSDPKPNQRFVDQVFLESSDEDNENEESFERHSLIKKLEKLENEKVTSDTSKKYSEEDSKFMSSSLSNSPTRIVPSHKRKFSSGSFSSQFPSDFSLQYQSKNQSSEQRKDLHFSKVKQRLKENLDNVQEIVISILWLQLEKAGSLWKNDEIKLLFVDFCFLDVKGEETETPKSLPKPKTPEEKCYFTFSKKIDLNESKTEIFHSLLNKPDLDLIVFKVVNEPEDVHDDSGCEDVGVAVVTVKQFLEKCNHGSFPIQVKNMNYTKEIVGTLGVSVEATPNVFSYKN